MSKGANVEKRVNKLVRTHGGVLCSCTKGGGAGGHQSGTSEAQELTPGVPKPLQEVPEPHTILGQSPSGSSGQVLNEQWKALEGDDGREGTKALLILEVHDFGRLKIQSTAGKV